MQPTRGGALANAAELLPVEHLPEYIFGYPVYVALTIQARPNSSLNRVRFPDFLDLRGAVGLEMFRQGGTESVHNIPKVNLHFHDELRGEALQPGEMRRMLIDISPLAGTALPPGDYQARLSLLASGELFTAPTVTLRFRSPSTVETAALAAVAPDRASAPNWAIWTTTCSEQSLQLQTRPALPAGNPLRFNVLLHQLFCAPEPPERFNPSLLDSLTGLYAPERDALKAELLHLHGSDGPGPQRARAQVLAAYPGLAWWMRMLAQGGGGFITSFRNPIYTQPPA